MTQWTARAMIHNPPPCDVDAGRPKFGPKTRFSRQKVDGMLLHHAFLPGRLLSITRCKILLQTSKCDLNLSRLSPAPCSGHPHPGGRVQPLSPGCQIRIVLMMPCYQACKHTDKTIQQITLPHKMQTKAVTEMPVCIRAHCIH